MGRVIFSYLVVLLIAAGCSSNSDPLWCLDESCETECAGAPVTPLGGQHPMVMSWLDIGLQGDGFDLDGDGEPDNKFGALSSLARSAIEDAFTRNEIVIPMELFDFESAAPDDCVKLAMYVGTYRLDGDEDQALTGTPLGDCNDHEPGINKAAVEIPGNFIDDDCDGLADETDIEDDLGNITTIPSDDTLDRDEDGVTIAAGDCDDTEPAVKGPSITEICSDGLDNDCDGSADWGVTGDDVSTCTPFDLDASDPIALDPLGFNPDGSPDITFLDARVVDDSGALQLSAGPSVFTLNMPVFVDVTLEIRISGALFTGTVVDGPDGVVIHNGRLGGVIDAHSADKITGLVIDEIGLSGDDSLLDAVFASILGPLLQLPYLDVAEDSPYYNCRTPDIDVDRDGLESFCDSDPLDEVQRVDICIDGDGTVIRDGDDGLVNCTEATIMVDGIERKRFADGISVEFNFETVPVLLPDQIPDL